MRSIEGAIRRFVKGIGGKPSKEVLMSLANNEADSLINTFYSVINEELDTFEGLPHQEEICALLKDIYMIIGVSYDVDRKLLTHRLNQLDKKIEILKIDNSKKFQDPETIKASLEKIQKEIEVLSRQTKEKESNQFDFMKYLICEVHNIKYLEYTLSKLPKLINVKDKEGNSILHSIIQKYVLCIIDNHETEQLYYGNVLSLLLSNPNLHLTEKEKGKIISEVYNTLSQVPKKKLKSQLQMEKIRGVVGKIEGQEERKSRIERIAKKYNISISFPTPIIEQVQHTKSSVSSRAYRDRVVIDDYIITIDKEGAIEVDDALSCRKLPNGNYLYGIHDATVLGYFPYDSPIVEEALSRTRSIYVPKKYQKKEENYQRIIPMLPYEFSAKKGSLIEGAPRLARSYYFEITPDGEIVQEKFLKTIITNKKKASYQEIDKVIAHGSKNPELQKLVQNLQGVTSALEKRYKPNEFYEQIKEETQDFSDLRVNRSGSQKIVYYAMMLTGNRVGTFFFDKGYPCLYRTLKLDELDAAKLKELIDRISKTDGGEQYQKLNQLIKGMYPKGIYASEGSHDGLRLDHYCHITSPLRRGADIVVENGLEICYDRDPTDKELYLLEEEVKKRANQINSKQDPIEWFVRDYKRAYQKRR